MTDHFDFEACVDLKGFKRALRRFGYSEAQINKADLPSLFKEVALDWFVRNNRISSSFIPFLGFKSEEALPLFLNDQEIAAQLLEKIKPPPTRMSATLAEKIQSTYDRAVANQQTAETHDEQVLLGLFDIFELIKGLDDDEIDIIANYIPKISSSYFSGSSLKEFRHDLHTMDPLQFEEKYEGCFSGILDGVIKSILETESLFQHLDKLSKEQHAIQTHDQEHPRSDMSQETVKAKNTLSNIKKEDPATSNSNQNFGFD